MEDDQQLLHRWIALCTVDGWGVRLALAAVAPVDEGRTQARRASEHQGRYTRNIHGGHCPAHIPRPLPLFYDRQLAATVRDVCRFLFGLRSHIRVSVPPDSGL